MLNFPLLNAISAASLNPGSAAGPPRDLQAWLNSEHREALAWNLWRGSLAVSGVPLGIEWQGQHTPQAEKVFVGVPLGIERQGQHTPEANKVFVEGNPPGLFWNCPGTSPMVASSRSRVSRRRL